MESAEPINHSMQQSGSGHENSSCPDDTSSCASEAIRFAKALLTAASDEELFRIICEELSDIFNSDGAALYITQDRDLELKHSHGNAAAFIGWDMSSNAGRAFSENRAVTYSAPPGIDPGSLPLTAASLPLTLNSAVIGILTLFTKKALDSSPVQFNEKDIIMLSELAEIASAALSNRHECNCQNSKSKVHDRAELLKGYLDSFLENTADAIVTTDLEGHVTSWNKGAEKMYGFSHLEAIGQFMPFVPDFLIDSEKTFIDRVALGETLKEIETIRKKKDNSMIDVNLTLSPIKNSTGNVVGISGIARDITQKKKTEKNLLRRNSELSRILFISAAMRGTLELDKLLRMVLTAVTMGDGLGFNRAMLFLRDEKHNVLKGAMGVGPASHEEAWEIWARLSLEHKSLASILDEMDKNPNKKESFVDMLCKGIEISLDSDTILTRTVKAKKAYNVVDIQKEPLSDLELIQQFGTEAYASVPLISRDKVIGVLWVDNLFTRRPISEQDIEFLRIFSNQMASAIENAQLFESINSTEQQLSNIFGSISDLLFFTGTDYRINKVNKAVVDKIGLPEEEIVGKKCFQIFHGMQEPLMSCPHVKTLDQQKAFIEEVEDFHMGGTYIVSCSPLFDKSGALLGTVHIARDITEQKKLRQKVADAERMAALGEIAAKVAHEIRNPLLSVGGFARRLEKRLDNDLKEYAKIIVEEVGRLEEILNDTLGFVRSGRLDIKQTDMNAFIDKIITLLESAAAAKGDQLIKEADEKVSLQIDQNRLKEALINIINNAIQATKKSTIVVKAFYETRPDGLKEGIIEVEDHGAGIKTEDQNRIFDPFFTTRSSGTGLGLAITKKIIESHRGRIEVKSEIGKGTKFRIYLPAQEA
ncbi:MAG: PAS domain S-box protein [Dissulfurispiraceae bacterium]|jgi:PAS domain S-box-containing protein|nr:PAS domain S-box protein [Dissulfurispiraceae bacterium]